MTPGHLHAAITCWRTYGPAVASASTVIVTLARAVVSAPDAPPAVPDASAGVGATDPGVPGEGCRLVFHHWRVHRTYLRAILESRTPAHVARLLVARCPRCGVLYFSRSAGALAVSDAENLEEVVGAYLAHECPDHAHRFAVEV